MPEVEQMDAGSAGSTLLKRRLGPIMKSHGGAGAFADRAGVPRDSFNKYLRGMQPSPAVLIKLADAAETSIDYLLGRTNVAGLGLPVPAIGGPGRDDGGDETNAFTDPLAALGFVSIPRLDIKASAGPGRAVVATTNFDEMGRIAFRETWLRSLGVQSHNAELLEATGDSMEPTIKDGDLMLVDRGYGELANGFIYVLVVDGLVLVKRLQRLAVGGLMLISDNERYPTETVPRSEMDSLSIEARVVWYGRAL